MSSGLLFLVVGLIDNRYYRYRLFEVFQFGTDHIFKLVDWKFNTSKDNTYWVSYFNLAPLVNIVASIIWAGIFLLLYQLLMKNSKKSDVIINPFWKRVFTINLTISIALILFWLCFMNLNFIFDGVYSSSTNPFVQVYDFIQLVFFAPSIIPAIIASLSLDSGGDSAHGYGDMYLKSKVVTAFASTFWAIISVLIYDKVKKWRAEKIQITKQ